MHCPRLFSCPPVLFHWHWAIIRLDYLYDLNIWYTQNMIANSTTPLTFIIEKLTELIWWRLSLSAFTQVHFPITLLVNVWQFLLNTYSYHSHFAILLIFALCLWTGNNLYRKISNIRHILIGNKIVDHSDVDGASPVGAAPTTSSFSTQVLVLVLPHITSTYTRIRKPDNRPSPAGTIPWNKSLVIGIYPVASTRIHVLMSHTT